METTAYKSQQEAILRQAEEKKISLEDLNTVFDQKFDAIFQEHPGALPAWRLGRAEFLVWEKFFPDEPFPSTVQPPAVIKTSHSPRKVVLAHSTTTKDTKPPGVKGTDSYWPMDKMAMMREWVHDKYQVESPERRKASVENRNRKPDYYSGPAFPGRIDSYKPSMESNNGHEPPRSNNDHRGERHSSRPFSRGAEEHNDARYSVNKPTVYTTLHDYILNRAFAMGISPDSYHYAYYKYGKMAKEEKPWASAYWLLWRQECMIWKKFFPDEGFIGAEPKLKPTTWETAPANFSLMSSEELQRAFKCYPSYERLSKENDSQYPSQAHLIESKARARKISPERLVTVYEEKKKLVQSHFPKQCQEWHRWFVEATVWGHLFKDAPFPGREPRSPTSSWENKLVSTSTLDDNLAYSYAPQEKVMEQMALKKGIRKEFFQYLNTMRHDAIAVHPLCTCYARALFADRLTWHKFFKEPFPVAAPHHNHSHHCRANESSNAVPGAHRSTPAIQALVPVMKLPCTSGQSQPPFRQSTQAPIATQHHQRTQSQPPINNTHSNAVSPRLTSSLSSIPTRTAALSQSPQAQRNNVQSTFGHPYQQPSQRQPPVLAHVQAPVINPQSAPRALPASPVREAVDSPPPPGMLVALGEMRMTKQIPEGAVVMQNMDATICNRESVAQMFQCMRSEDPASIDSISNGLKCYFRYRRPPNGDLLLWVEPFTPEDSSAFAGGHLFLRGWVQRNLGFGIVPPSHYFDEIRNTTSFKQVASTTIPKFDAVPPTKSDKESERLSAMKLDNAKDTWGQKAEASVRDAVLVIRGDCVAKMFCSRAALKNLAFSFVIDSCRDNVEQRLRCTFSLTEPKEGNKHDHIGLELVVKPLWDNDKERLGMATRFARAWVFHAIQQTPCKASAFLASAEGVHTVSKSFSATPVSNKSGKPLGEPEKLQERKSLFNASDLDRMLVEETAKAEGSSRLVLDEVTGQIISVQELLKQTLYRASAKILESSATAEVPVEVKAAENDGDGCAEITGIDGQMKDMGGGKFVVVANSIDNELSDGAIGNCKGGEDGSAGERAEKEIPGAADGNGQAEDATETIEVAQEYALVGLDTEMAEAEEEMKLIQADRPVATTLENVSEVVGPSESSNGKRKAEDDEGQDRAEKKVCI